MVKKAFVLLSAMFLVLFNFSAVQAGASIDQQYTAGGGSVSIYNAYGRFAQTFMPTMTKLDKVELELTNVPESKTLSISIRHRNNLIWDEGFLATVSNQAVTNGWNTFDFEDLTLLISATDSYGIWIDCDDSSIQWKYIDGPSTYDRGFAIWQSTDKPDWDYNFKTWGYDPTEIVDENTQPTDQTDDQTTEGETLSETTSSAIAKPTSLTAKFSDEKKAVELLWKATTTVDIDGYKIFRSESSNKGFVKMGDTKKDVLTYLDDDYTAGKTYYYQVRAYKGSEQSASSNVASLTLPDDIAPAKPQNLSVVDTTEKGLTARWKKSEATNLAGYTINLYKGSEKIRTKELPAKANEYSFLDLETGTLYKVELIAKDSENKTSSPAYAFGITKLPESWVQIASTFNLAASLVIIVLIGYLAANTVKTMRKKRV